AAGVAGLPGAPPLLAGTGEDKVHLIIVATADRGLCGGFNSSITRGARRRIAELRGEGRTVKLMTVGRKGRDQLRREHGDAIVEHVEGVAGKRRIEYAEAAAIARNIVGRYEAGEFDVCSIVFNRFQSAVTQVLTVQQLIPAQLPEQGEA